MKILKLTKLTKLSFLFLLAFVIFITATKVRANLTSFTSPTDDTSFTEPITTNEPPISIEPSGPSEPNIAGTPAAEGLPEDKPTPISSVVVPPEQPSTLLDRDVDNAINSPQPTTDSPNGGSSNGGGYQPLAPIPGLNNIDVQNGDLLSYVTAIFKLVLGIAGVLAVIMIIIGGLEYLTSESIQSKSDGKDRIFNALKGLLIAAVSWILLNTINPDLLKFNIKLSQTSDSIELLA
jgi:hypothetical protein